MQQPRTPTIFFLPACWAWLLVAFLLVSCAAPAPPQVTSVGQDEQPAPVIFIADPDAAREDRIDALSHFMTPPLATFAKQDGAWQIYVQDELVNSEGGVILIGDDSIPEELFTDMLDVLSVTESAFGCTQSGDMAFGAIKPMALADLSNDSDVGQTIADCSNVAGPLAADGPCDDCGCIGPMDDDPPQCTANGMQIWDPDSQ
ncbi:MAG: hypothetical protein WBO46_16005 [Caldilineaceae bacterium]